MKFLKHAALAALVLLAVPAFAGSTINPAVPAPNSPMASAPIRNNFAAAYNDVNNILTDFAGPSAPLNPSTNQSWMNTTVSTAWVLNIYDGSQWVQLGTLNPVAHTFTYTGLTVPLPTPSTLGGSFSKAAVSHFFLTGLGTNGIYTVGQPVCADISDAGTVCTKNTGKSVADPGTGALESLLPIQTVASASKTYATADLQYETRRSNGGSAMTDTFPSSVASGMANGTRITVANVDASANDTITAGSGTSFSGGPTDVVESGRAITYIYDSASSIWRTAFNTRASAIFTSTGTNVSGDVVTVGSAYGKVQDSGTSLSSLVTGPASATSGNVPTYNGTTGKIIQDSGINASSLVTGSSTNTFTNKTFDTAGTGNSFSINGVAATDNTGTGKVVRQTSPTLTTPTLGAATATSLNFGQQNLSYYGENTWTPTDASGASLTLTVTGATYTRIGNLVIASGNVLYPTTASGASAKIGGLPFVADATNAYAGFVAWTNAGTNAAFMIVIPSTSTAAIYIGTTGNPTTNANLSGKSMYFIIIYNIAV